MKLFAALERALLARWRKIKVALKVNKWPLLSLKEQRLQLKKQYLESLFRKKWQKFVKSIYDLAGTQVPPETHWDCTTRTVLHMSRTHETVNRVSRVYHNHNKDVYDTEWDCQVYVSICWRYSWDSWVSHNHVGLRCNVWERWNLNTISDWTAIIST